MTAAVYQSAPIVTAAELVRNFGQWRQIALQQPVYITSHGRKTHVLASLNDFAGRMAEAQPIAAKAQPGNDDLVAVADWVEEAVIICDRDLNVISANRVAHAICRRMPGSIADRPLIEALPEIGNTLMEVHVRRTAVSSEPGAVDLPSPFAPGAWLRMQCFPLGVRNIVMFRDITEDVQRHRLADVKEAILEAMTVHGGIGYVRVTPRGTIDRVDQPFCDLLGLPETRVMNVDLCDLVAIGDRPAFREMIETVLAGQRPQRIETGFLTNRGPIVRTHVAMVQLQGAYAVEGAVVLITHAEMGSLT